MKRAEIREALDRIPIAERVFVGPFPVLGGDQMPYPNDRLFQLGGGGWYKRDDLVHVLFTNFKRQADLARRGKL